MQVVKAWPESEMKIAVVDAYVKSLRMVWVIMCILAGCMFVSSLAWIKEIGLKRELETEQGFRHTENHVALADEESVEL